MYIIINTGGHSGGIGAVDAYDPDVPASRAVTGIGDFIAQGRELRLYFASRVAGESGGGGTLCAFDVEIGIWRVSK